MSDKRDIYNNPSKRNERSQISPHNTNSYVFMIQSYKNLENLQFNYKVVITFVLLTLTGRASRIRVLRESDSIIRSSDSRDSSWQSHKICCFEFELLHAMTSCTHIGNCKKWINAAFIVLDYRVSIRTTDWTLIFYWNKSIIYVRRSSSTVASKKVTCKQQKKLKQNNKKESDWLYTWIQKQIWIVWDTSAQVTHSEKIEIMQL